MADRNSSVDGDTPAWDDTSSQVAGDVAAAGQHQTAGRQSTVDWDGLPEPVRAKLAEIAGAAVVDLAKVDVPQHVRPVVKFAPAKRAKLGGAALLAGLRGVTSFRSAVLQWCREHQPEVLDVGASDPVAVATALVLLDDPAAQHYLELVSRRAAASGLRAERDTALARASKLAAEVDRLSAELAAVRSTEDEIRAERAAEVDRLRQRLREQGVKLREAKDEAAGARDKLAGSQADWERKLAELAAERDRERDRANEERLKAERAMADAEVARQSAREARQADEVRLALLVDTLAGAVTGLRRELALSGTGPRPADTVRGASISRASVGRVEDPAALDRLLALSSVHLVVDGYNVTKTGYPELPLSDQRDRLVHQLAALAARTGAEVTVVFDGAGVVAVPSTSPRGVRVLFSDPGVQADDVIRALVAAEPEGRPLVVATSDRAVADSVRRRGAHPVPSAVLVARLGRV